MKFLRIAAPIVLLPLLIGCGGSAADGGTSSGREDARDQALDAAPRDATRRDASDAALTESGAHDSGAPDSAGQDGGSSDSAAVEAALLDSASPDAAVDAPAPVDGGVVDADVPDSSLREAGVPDAFEEDSGKVDATTDAKPADATSDSKPVDAAADSKPVDAGHDAQDAHDAGQLLSPTVVSTAPSNGATSVSISKILSATFSEPMKSTTLTSATFTLQRGAAVVPGTVTYLASGTEATFVPTQPLEVGSMYRATITTGASSAAGAPLANDYTWSFTTAACGQAPVVLNSAATFGVLAGSTVTSQGPTSVTGNIGVSPGTAVTGFPPGTVTGGAIQAGNPSAAQAEADLTTAYNDAAGRTLCAVTVAGNIGGQTLSPGLYKSTSSLAVSSGNLTLDAQGDPNAVFIFQMASTLTVTSGLKVILSGGASAANVFWQVGTAATLGTTSAFEGTIMASKAISMDTGATLNGRVLASSAAVTLLSNTIVTPAP